MPALLSFALLAILFSVPQPSILVNQPFKAELLLSIFLIAFFVLMPQQSQVNLSAHAKAIACSIGGFVLWSGLSVLWGTSFGSAVHHTLLWSMYLAVFLIFTSSLRPDANLRFITTTFAIVALVLGSLCIFDYLTVIDFVSSEGDIRIRYGKYAELLVTISPILWAAALYMRKRRQVIFILTALLSWITVMLSLSKGAFLAGIIGFAIFFAASFALSAKMFRERVAVFAAVWLAVTIGIQVFFSFFSAAPSTTSYITGTADQTRSTSTMRIFTWSVAGEMARGNWLLGVGADSFGVTFNNARIPYRDKRPVDTSAEIGEDYIVERAHNEPLQVLSELGVIGLLLFALPFVLFGVYFTKKILRDGLRPSPVLWAAFAGMSAFAVSSQFSSFSFRSAQNGVVFFMVFAAAVNELSKSQRKASRTTHSSRPIAAAGWIAVLLMATFCATKVFAQYHVYMGERSPDYGSAVNHFQTAVRADPEYAGAYLSHAGRAIKEGDHVAAAQLTRRAIDNGLGITTVYSQLAKQQIEAGNAAQAEATYHEALSIYPQSVYLRMEFVVFLEDYGKSDAAAAQAAISRSINLRQANGWHLIIKEGSVAAFYRAKEAADIAPPADLLPYAAVRQYVDKVPGV